MLLARNIVVDGEITYLSQAAELESAWHKIPQANGLPCPFSFTEEERQNFKAELDGVLLGMNLMSSIRDSIGELFPEKGIVAPHQYDESLDTLEQMKEQIIKQYANSEEEAAV